MLYVLSQLSKLPKLISKLKNVNYKSEQKNIIIKDWDIIMYLLIFETLVSKNSKCITTIYRYVSFWLLLDQ